MSIHLASIRNSKIHLSTDAATTDAQRLWAIDQLAALIKNTAVPRDDTWILDILELLIVHGFFAVSKKSTKSPVKSVRTRLLYYIDTILIASFLTASRFAANRVFHGCQARVSPKVIRVFSGSNKPKHSRKRFEILMPLVTIASLIGS